MERALLRLLPSRPLEPVEPATATRHVAAFDAGLSAREAETLALVTLAGRSRAEAARETGLSVAELGCALAAARKALRRSLRPLAANGWCERAEGLISDRLDGALDEPGASRLGVHLRNCPRCVEHERRLVQALDALVAAYEQQRSATAAATTPLAVVPPPAPTEPATVEPDATEAQVAEPEVLGAASSLRRAGSAFLAWYVLIALGALLMLVAAGLALAGVEL